LVNKNATNPTLQSFYNANISSNIGKFTDVQTAVANSQKTLAQSKNNAIVPSNAVQQKTKRTNELMLKLTINCNYVFTNTELQDLVSYANECAVKGWYVAQARSMLNSINKTVIDYADNCDEPKLNARIAATTQPSLTVTTFEIEFVLYPNPSNGQMELQYVIQNKQAAELIIMDVTGRLISHYELPENSSNLHINELELKSGVYFYTIKQNDYILKQAKFVIIN
jgi:hypothetical protein